MKISLQAILICFANRQFKTDRGGSYIGGIVRRGPGGRSFCHEWTFVLAEQNYI